MNRLLKLLETYMKVLWATTFSADLWEASGRRMVESFVSTGTSGKLVAYTEGMNLPSYPNCTGHRLEGNAFLTKFLAKNRDVIPVEMGGDVKPKDECKCPGGPYDVHGKQHKLPCVHYWFCRNAYRWLRKVLSAKLAADSHPDFDILIWVDSDGLFKRKVEARMVNSWFRNGAGCAYLKNKRKAIETGVVCYHLRHGGRKIIDTMSARYESGLFRANPRWDDCVQLEMAIKSCPDVLTYDLAYRVGPNNTVIQYSPLGKYLAHEKGKHRRAGLLK